MSDAYFDLDASRMMWAMGICRDAIMTYLDGALIEPLDEGALIVATNGSIMLVQHDREAVAPRRAILRLTPPVPPERDELDDYDQGDGWHWEGARVRIPASVAEDEPRAAPVHWTAAAPGTHMIAHEMAPAMQFPDWRRAWRAPYGGGKIAQDGGVSIRLLAQICGPHKNARMVSRGVGRPYVISFHDDSRALGLLMPCSAPSDDDQIRADMMTLAGLTEPEVRTDE